MPDRNFPFGRRPNFDRLFRSLVKHHPELTKHFGEVLRLLRTDPCNSGRTHPIRKLESVKAGEGQFRLRLGSWRFRYDTFGHDVVLHYCRLRREDTYR